MNLHGIWEEACEDCLKTCFEVLGFRLASNDADAEEAFKRCCDLCKESRKIAEQITED